MTFRVLEPRPTTGADQLAIDVLVGLSERPKRLPSSLFYDDEGSRLFQAITKTPDYYPPRAELEIFGEHGQELLSGLRGKAVNVVDLGAGDGHKTAVLLEQLRGMGTSVRYVPIDISGGALATVTASMAERFPGLEIEGLQSEYFNGLRWLGEQSDRQSLVLFLGSNIGNFDKAHARGFLRQLWMALNDGDLALIGFDLKKDIERLLAAYNDSDGLTAAFNINLLTRMNRELGADFDVSRFRHYGTYNAETGAMESYLVSQEQQTVRIPALQATFDFQPWEPIHTEYSYKYLRTDIQDLARFTGFEILDEALDANDWFCSSLWRAQKKG